MDGSATSSSEALEVDALVETESRILELVQKDLSQEYIRFMSRLVKERLAQQAGGKTSAFDHLRKAAESSSGPSADS
jgi:hypothetical protein